MNASLLLQFTRQDLIDRHASSVLGAVWTLVLPLVNILIFTLIFSQIMGIKLAGLGMESLGQYGYSVYLVSGLLAWNCFAGTLSRTTQVFHEKAGLIGKVRIHLPSLPLYVLLSETIIYLISMMFFAAFLVLIDFDWSVNWLWWPLIFAIQQLLAYSLGLLCAILSVFIRDIREIVSVVVQLWFWMTPIVYVLTIVPDGWQPLFVFNPIYHTINALRDVMIMQQPPAFLPMLILATAGGALLMLSLWLGKRLERDIRDFL